MFRSLAEMEGFFYLPFIKLFYRSSQLQEIAINSFVDLRKIKQYESNRIKDWELH